MKKNYKRLIYILFIILFIIPLIKFTINYFENEPKDVLLEINSNQVITKYKFNQDIDGADNIAAILSNNQKTLTSIKEHTYKNLDEYYNEIIKQYGIIEENEDEEVSLFFGQKENDGVNNFTDSQEVVLNNEDIQTINSFKNKKILNRFSGSALDAKNKKLLEIEDKVALSLDEESDNDKNFNLETYINEKFSKKYERSYKNLLVENDKKFYTSPPPDNTKDNEIKKLNNLTLNFNKNKYYRFEIVRANLVSKDSINIKDLKIKVTRGKYEIPNVGGKTDFFFRYKNNTIYVNLALGYNPSPGEYVLNIKSLKNSEWKGIKKPFTLLKRKVPPLQKGFSVMNWEYNGPINLKIISPDRKVGGVETLITWLKYMDVDAFWLLAAQTSGWYKKTTPDSPWVHSGLRNLNVLAKLAKEKDILVGAYVMSYFTPANGKKLAGYNPSLGFNPKVNKLEDSLHISLLDDRRLKDIIETAKLFQANPNVDFVGLDFIRTGRADGYEMGPQVIEDMNIKTPSEYKDYNTIQKIKWFARTVENLSNRREVTKWRWWRAHRVATIANTVIREAKLTKPMWVFTLGWNHGQQHGQDPYMFFDAGVFVDAIMLYEANRIQFRNMMVQWPNYMRDHINNLVIGNASDIRFLDNNINNYGAEYIYRSKKAYRGIYRSSKAKGLFIHDLSRILWSSKRGYDISEWAILHGYTTTAFRAENGLFPYRATIHFNKDLLTGEILLENMSGETVFDLEVKPAYTPAWSYIKDNLPEKITLGPKEKKLFKFKAKIRDKYINDEKLLGYHIKSADYRKYFFLTYYTKRDIKKLMAYIK